MKRPVSKRRPRTYKFSNPIRVRIFSTDSVFNTAAWEARTPLLTPN